MFLRNVIMAAFIVIFSLAEIRADQELKPAMLAEIVDKLLECSAFYEFGAGCMLNTLSTNGKTKDLTNLTSRSYQMSMASLRAAFDLADEIGKPQLLNKTINVKRDRFYNDVEKQTGSSCLNFSLLTEQFGQKCKLLLE